MTNEEAIKYLQQLYPNGGHCWLDEQRIEAIGMAIQALQKEPVSEDLDKAAENWIDDDNNTRGADYIGVTVAEDAFKAGARWQKQQMMKEVIEAECFGFQWEQALFSFKLPSNKYHVGSKKKIILIKED